MAGLSTLEACEPKVIISLNRDFIDIADHLEQTDVFNSHVYDTVTGYKSSDRGQLFFNHLCDAVQENDKAYQVFVDFLRQRPLHSAVVKILDEEYAKQSQKS